MTHLHHWYSWQTKPGQHNSPSALLKNLDLLFSIIQSFIGENDGWLDGSKDGLFEGILEDWVDGDEEGFPGANVGNGEGGMWVGKVVGRV